MSQKPVAQKLQIKENYMVMLVNEPKAYRSMLGALPRGVTVLTERSRQADLIQVFVASSKELKVQLSALKPLLKTGGLLWVTYPKGTSKVKTDINRDSIREFAQSLGFQAVALFSVDDTWSALRLKAV